MRESLPRHPVDVDLSAQEFWQRPLPERDDAFALLRARDRPAFFAEPDLTALGLPPGPGYHALVRHADVTEATCRPEVFCSSQGNVAYTIDPPEEFQDHFSSMINMDGPEHARMRRIVSRAFSAKMVNALMQNIDATAARLVEEFAALGGGDFVELVAAPLPMEIICDMMGIPREHRYRVYELSRLIMGSSDIDYVPEPTDTKSAMLEAVEELQELVSTLVAERRSDPGEDLVSVLAHAQAGGERLTDSEIGAFFILLVVAGNETTRNAISHGLDLLTRHPAQRDLWREDFDRHATGAAEEIVRWASPVIFMRRTLTRDFRIRGHLLRAGEKVMLYHYSANRDERVFRDPRAFDITRSPNPHLGYGAPGPHFCLGAHLARREIVAVFRHLFRVAPGTHATAPPERLYSNFINGIEHLPSAV